MDEKINFIPLLTIAIPTFNRLALLKDTVNSLAPFHNSTDVEIVIIDNCSSDGTWQWLNSLKDKNRIQVLKNNTNLGIEGNIIQALFSGFGKYVWLLSDHMIVYPNEIKKTLLKLKNGLNFDLGFARVSAHDNVLTSTYNPIEIKTIDQETLGKIIFYMANISAFLCKREYLYLNARNVYRFSSFSFPHIGVFLNAKDNTTIVELPSQSEFSTKSYGKYRISYDTFRSRFIGFIKMFKQIRKLNSNFSNINKGLNTRLIISALAGESILDLCFSKGKGISTLEYLFCFISYPGKIRFFLLTCIFLSLWPNSIKKWLSRMVFRIVLPGLYKKIERSAGECFSDETFKE